MARLTRAARETIKWSAITIAAYIRDQGGDADGRTWHGDECGCADDRCIGYHHEPYEECGCLPVLLSGTKARLTTIA